MERKSRQTLVVDLGDSYDAANTAKTVTQALGKQPSHMMKTLTWDQSREMTRWADIEKAVGIKVYLCEPHSPCQQPHHEQTNSYFETLAIQTHQPQHRQTPTSNHRRLKSTTCPKNSTTRTQPKPYTTNHVTITNRACHFTYFF